jgi:hypothetical protein
MVVVGVAVLGVTVVVVVEVVVVVVVVEVNVTDRGWIIISPFMPRDFLRRKAFRQASSPFGGNGILSGNFMNSENRVQ